MEKKINIDETEKTRNTLTSFSLRLYLIGFIAVVIFCCLLATFKVFGLLEGIKIPDQFTFLFFLLLVVTTLVFWYVGSLAWRKAVYLFSGHTIGLWSGFAQTALVLVGKYLPGKIWGLALRGKVLAGEKVTAYQVLLSSYAEQIISLHAACFLGALGWLYDRKPFGWEVYLLMVLASPLIASLINNRMIEVMQWLKGRFFPSSVPIAISLSARSYLTLFLFYLAEWVLIGSILAILWFMLFPDAYSIGLLVYILAACALAMLAGFLAFFSPGGIGVREGALVFLLAPHMALPDAIYLAVIFRVWLVLADVTAGLMAAKILHGEYVKRI